MSSFNTSGKIGYIFNTSDNTWYALTGVANPAASYVWTGSNSYTGASSFSDTLKSSKGINNFGSPTSGLVPRRDTALPSPSDGAMCLIRQKDDGTTVNLTQYFHNGSWQFTGNQSISSKNASYTLQIADGNQILLVDTSEGNTITIPLNSSVPFSIGQSVTIIQTGAGQTTMAGAVGVIVNSRLSMTKISERYGYAKLTKTAVNTWVLLGDLE